ncbi:thymidylate kinase [secondary endosymbiont of Heteropsylla cubana]|uniref:Thymidylate kinase n=1 Tax=secondary endosymbiont of Heteropsylla cubana TaxID=134287 RepID=J7GWP4_9ENTR|nr:dTMP kinase [secondary endosymbiont of Heteropsylla cubana]AFP85886.1 thymidylate kinase [secondary endosymbiont of Heteropsylla cubana]
MNGKFIAIEGLEGAGKTNAIKQVGKILQEQGVHKIVFTREPGGTPLAEALRTLVKYGIDDEVITHEAELLMLYAARVQVLENVIKPAVTQGAWVVTDRYDLSSQAYQGGGRGIDSGLLNTLRDTILGNFYPDLTLYMDVAPSIGLKRVRSRTSGELDRIEVEPLAFFERIRSRYQILAEKDDRIITLDASQELSEVTSALRVQLIKWLKNKGY